MQKHKLYLQMLDYTVVNMVCSKPICTYKKRLYCLPDKLLVPVYAGGKIVSE